MKRFYIEFDDKNGKGLTRFNNHYGNSSTLKIAKQCFVDIRSRWPGAYNIRIIDTFFGSIVYQED